MPPFTTTDFFSHESSGLLELLCGHVNGQHPRLNGFRRDDETQKLETQQQPSKDKTLIPLSIIKLSFSFQNQLVDHDFLSECFLSYETIVFFSSKTAMVSSFD
jgi:hypothetical protein